MSDDKKEPEPFHIKEGTAKDQEYIISIRSQIEDFVAENIGEFSSTKLFWNMNEDKTFWYELHFYEK